MKISEVLARKAEQKHAERRHRGAGPIGAEKKSTEHGQAAKEVNPSRWVHLRIGGVGHGCRHPEGGVHHHHEDDADAFSMCEAKAYLDDISQLILTARIFNTNIIL